MKISSGKTYTGKLHNKNLFIRNDTYLPRRYNCSNFIQMAKRKNDCSLDNFIARFLKKRKYGKTLKLFESKISNGGDVNSKAFDGFENSLKEKIKNEQNNDDSDDCLGFKINFGAFQPTQKVISSFQGLKITIELSIQQQSVFFPTLKNQKSL